MTTRQKWPSRYVYILAAIGCAAGLGNLWRFPMLAYEYGGAAFILALIVSNIVIVYPLLMLETVLGQKYQAGAPEAMEKLKKGTAWIQWIPLIALTFLLMYYVPIMAWGVNYLFQSFSGEFLTNPSNYFTEKILGLTSGVGEPGTMQSGILMALVVSYILIIMSLRKGVQSVSQVVKFTATAPFSYSLFF
jgi:NSS family neurotransmitter:Na+ symporter